MEIKIGKKVRHKMTGEGVLILEIGPKSKRVLVPGHGYVMQEYLEKGIVRVRLPDMRVIDIYEYEIEGIDPIPETGQKNLLVEN